MKQAPCALHITSGESVYPGRTQCFDWADFGSSRLVEGGRGDEQARAQSRGPGRCSSSRGDFAVRLHAIACTTQYRCENIPLCPAPACGLVHDESDPRHARGYYRKCGQGPTWTVGAGQAAGFRKTATVGMYSKNEARCRSTGADPVGVMPAIFVGFIGCVARARQACFHSRLREPCGGG